MQTGAFLDQTGWRHCFIGGVAYLRWGEPRQTVDVDAVLLAGFGNEEEFATVLTTCHSVRCRLKKECLSGPARG